MRRLFSFALLALVAIVEVAVAQPEEQDAPIFYVVKQVATVYSQADSTRPYLQLGFREPVFVQDVGKNWYRVKTQDGAQGYVYHTAISNYWIRVSKRKKTLYLYQGTELVKKYAADFGYNAFADKERRGNTLNPDDWRTPEGVFFVVRKNPNSQFYQAFVLNYPNSEDAERGLREGLISRAEYNSIVSAENNFRIPPMGTALGGMIEIHGDGTGKSYNWTQGCIALQNEHIDELWDIVSVGTPVLVER